MPYDIVIKHGTVVTAEGRYQADVAIEGEEIAAIGLDLTGHQTLDASDKYVIPGAVDVHVHLEMPIGAYRSADDFYSGTRAAAFGGTTAVVDFVEARPDQPLVEALAERQAHADPKVTIDYGLHMTIGPHDINKLEQVAAVYEAGCGSFKLYMAYGLRLDDGQLLQALSAIKNVGGLPVVHAENWDAITTLIARNVALGRTHPRWHPRSRPALLEGEAAGRVIDLATYVDTPLYIFHVGCAATIERIAAARARGLPITAETCPQYLFQTDAAYEQTGVAAAYPVCSPPLRSEADQQRTWQALAHNDLQSVSTDHCPFSHADKLAGYQQNNFSLIPGGVPSIEMRLAGVYQGVERGILSLERWVDVCCTTPARLLGFQRKGQLTVGYDADVVIFDPKQPHTLSTQSLHEQVDWTLYDGLELVGWPSVTLSRGKIVVQEGEFKGEAGRGRFVKRHPKGR